MILLLTLELETGEGHLSDARIPQQHHSVMSDPKWWRNLGTILSRVFVGEGRCGCQEGIKSTVVYTVLKLSKIKHKNKRDHGPCREVWASRALWRCLDGVWWLCYLHNFQDWKS